jgi:hypothetical protein
MPTDVISRELINGHIIWDHVDFAPMSTYKREIQGPSDRPLVTINVVDVSGHSVFDDVTKWIRDNLLSIKEPKIDHRV